MMQRKGTVQVTAGRNISHFARRAGVMFSLVAPGLTERVAETARGGSVKQKAMKRNDRSNNIINVRMPVT